jgi:protoheme IX farnesyltransferase
LKGDFVAVPSTTASIRVQPGLRSRAQDYVALAKPRLNLLVVASTVAGYVMARGDTADAVRMMCTIAGTGLVAGGASAFNQVLERGPDGLMRRTRLRPLPDRRLGTPEALVLACALSVAGLLILAAGVNLLSAGVALATLASYAVVYTPLKRRSSFATVIGAIPGALPPVIGWAAARGGLSQGAWVLFGILFLWQLPHFLAIAWMYREDYARAGFVMLPVIEPDGRSTARQAVIYSAALLPLAMAPTLVGMAGAAYFVASFALSLAFLVLAVRFARSRAVTDARRLFLGSIAYLPLLWILMIADQV